MSEAALRSARPATAGLLLALDTAGERCSACVLDMGGGTILAAAEPAIGRGHAEALMEIVAGVLKEAGAGYADLSRLAVNVGPGSFTGIRVGVSASRGLALALGIPAVGVDALEAMAAPHLNGTDAVLAVHDARRGEVYAALYRADRTVLAPPSALAPAALAGFVGHHASLTLAGSGAALAAAALPGIRTRITAGASLPSIADIARIGAGRAPGEPVRPLYLRAADAKPPAASKLFGVDSSSNPPLPLK